MQLDQPTGALRFPAPAGWSPGTVVAERYRLVAKIATGGMAEIWLAQQLGLKSFQKLVAIKKIAEHVAKDPELTEMFFEEARLAAQLSHPNVVQVYDLGEHAGAYYIAMEYLPGENLAQVVRAGRAAHRPLPLPLAVKIISDAAAGLSSAHTKAGLDGKPLGIVHRDVSPQNLVVTYDGVVKVLDFGVAKATKRATSGRSGQIKGKLEYMSPEQARGEAIDQRSDVFSLGIVLFEAVTSSRLYQFDEPFAALTAITGPDPAPLARTKNPQIPQVLEQIIARALAKDLTARYQSSLALHSALEEWLRAFRAPPRNSDVGGYMRQLFQDRMAQRAAVLDRLNAGELAAAAATVATQLKPTTDRSMPGSGEPEQLTRRERPAPPAPTEPELPAAAVALSAPAAARRGGWGRYVVAIAAAVGSFYAITASTSAFKPRSGDLLEPSLPPTPAIEVPVRAVPPPPPEPEAAKPAPSEPPAAVVAPAAAEPEAVALTKRNAKRLAPVQRAAQRPLPAEPAAREEPPSAVALGKLTLDTVPWTEVSLGGKKLGETPLIDVPLNAGKHVLQLRNDERQIRTTLEVEISAGQTTVKKVRL